MSTHDQFQRKSRQTALCGLLAALSVAIMSLGSVIPLATVAAPMLAMICLLPVVDSYGAGPSLLVYAAVSVLGLLLCADKEAACIYLFLGWYPALRPRLARLPGIPGAAVKCGLYTLAMAAMYALLLFLFRLEAVAAEFEEYSVWMLGGLLVMGNITFLLFDRALATLTAAFRRRKRR